MFYNFAALHMKAERYILFLLAAFLLFAGGLFLRLNTLDERPVHADEATGARILAERLEDGVYRFDPHHFHGPLLTAAAAPIARVRGETSWLELSAGTLRLGPALFGGLTVLLAAGFVRWTRLGALAAAGLIATSPLLVYYSRMFIHETLFGMLATASVLALFFYLDKPGRLRALLAGLAAGLLMATRETFVICFFAWAVAAVLVWAEHKPWKDPAGTRALLGNHSGNVLLAALAAAATVVVFYTNLGAHPAGMIDFFRTFLVYETVDGHDKPFGYYAWLLLWPKFQGGVWWTEAGVALAGLAGFVLSFRRSGGGWIRFLFYAAIIQWLVYSFISYKTPWLIVTAWLHLCLVAGAAFAVCPRKHRFPTLAAAALVLVLLLGWQYRQTDRAIHRYASDTRNPYAYVPTATDVDRLERWLLELAEEFPEIQTGPVAVIGPHYWPLPWYLRGLPAHGYWPEIPPDGQEFPVLLVMPGRFPEAEDKLSTTHTSFLRGLRADTPVSLYLRNDLWEAYLAEPEEES